MANTKPKKQKPFDLNTPFTGAAPRLMPDLKPFVAPVGRLGTLTGVEAQARGLRELTAETRRARPLAGFVSAVGTEFLDLPTDAA